MITMSLKSNCKFNHVLKLLLLYKHQDEKLLHTNRIRKQSRHSEPDSCPADQKFALFMRLETLLPCSQPPGHVPAESNSHHFKILI
jgi:hypothetical protein